MNIIELNHIDLNSIGLNSKVIEGVGKSHGGKVKPYIKGHVTDGSSTFTITLNSGGDSVTVPVNLNGNWKYVCNGTDVYRFNFQNKNYDEITIKGNIYLYSFGVPKQGIKYDVSGFAVENAQSKGLLSKCDLYIDGKSVKSIPITLKLGLTDYTYSFLNNDATATIKALSSESDITLIMKKNNADLSYSFTNINSIKRLKIVGKGVNISNNFNTGAPVTLEIEDIGKNKFVNVSLSATQNIIVNEISADTNFAYRSNGSGLTEQSIVNIFNAVVTDGITLTFHSTVGAMIEEQLEIDDSPIYNAYWNKYDEGIEINYQY